MNMDLENGLMEVPADWHKLSMMGLDTEDAHAFVSKIRHEQFYLFFLP